MNISKRQSFIFYIALVQLLLPQFFVEASDVVAAGEENSIKVTIGGVLDAQFGVSDRRSPYSKNTLPDSNVNSPGYDPINRKDGISTRINSAIQIKVLGLYNGVKYGGVIFSYMGNSRHEDDFGYIGYQNYLFIENSIGKYELGNTYSASSKMRYDASNIARATGGIQGDWWRYVAFPTFDTSALNKEDAAALAIGHRPMFILQPMLPNEAGFTVGALNGNYIYGSGTAVMYQNKMQSRLGWGSTSSKISYYTPRLSGFQFGFSYSPDTGSMGSLARYDSAYAVDAWNNPWKLGGETGRNSGDVRDFMAFGVNYVKQIGNLGVALSITHERGSAERMMAYNNGVIYGVDSYPKRYGLNATAYGINLTYGAYSFAYSYGDWGKSLAIKDLASNPYAISYNSNGEVLSQRSYYHSLGVAVNYGPIGGSITYLHSNYMGNMTDALSFGTDIRVAGLKRVGLVPYLELTFYKMRGAYAKLSISDPRLFGTQDNSGGVAIAGVKMIF